MTLRNFPLGIILALALVVRQLAAVDVGNEIIDMNDEFSGEIQAPSQIGATFLVSGFTDWPRSGQSISSLYYAGPGIFADYRLNDSLTFSLSQYFVFQPFNTGVVHNGSQTGLFVKHWMSDTWGYVGLGMEYFNRHTDTGTQSDIMVSLLLTGENVQISRRLNSVGDLKLSASAWNNQGLSDFRFQIQYNIGLGFEL